MQKFRQVFAKKPPAISSGVSNHVDHDGTVQNYQTRPVNLDVASNPSSESEPSTYVIATEWDASSKEPQPDSIWPLSQRSGDLLEQNKTSRDVLDGSLSKSSRRYGGTGSPPKDKPPVYRSPTDKAKTEGHNQQELKGRVTRSPETPKRRSTEESLRKLIARKSLSVRHSKSRSELEATLPQTIQKAGQVTPTNTATNLGRAQQHDSSSRVEQIARSRQLFHGNGEGSKNIIGNTGHQYQGRFVTEGDITEHPKFYTQHFPNYARYIKQGVYQIPPPLNFEERLKYWSAFYSEEGNDLLRCMKKERNVTDTSEEIQRHEKSKSQTQRRERTEAFRTNMKRDVPEIEDQMPRSSNINMNIHQNTIVPNQKRRRDIVRQSLFIHTGELNRLHEMEKEFREMKTRDARPREEYKW